MNSMNGGPNRLLTSKGRESIFAWLHTHGIAPLKDIKQACSTDHIKEVSENSVGSILRKMVKLGVLSKPKYGHYAVNKELGNEKRDIRSVHFAVWDFNAQSTHDGKPIFDGHMFETMEFLCNTFENVSDEQDSGLWINGFDLSDSMYFNSLTLKTWIQWFNQVVYPVLDDYDFTTESYPAHFNDPCMVHVNMSMAPHATYIAPETYRNFIAQTAISKATFDQLCRRWSNNFRSDALDRQPTPTEVEHEVIAELNRDLEKYDQMIEQLIEENIELKNKIKKLEEDSSN